MKCIFRICKLCLTLYVFLNCMANVWAGEKSISMDPGFVKEAFRTENQNANSGLEEDKSESEDIEEDRLSEDVVIDLPEKIKDIEVLSVSNKKIKFRWMSDDRTTCSDIYIKKDDTEFKFFITSKENQVTIPLEQGSTYQIKFIPILCMNEQRYEGTENTVMFACPGKVNQVITTALSDNKMRMEWSPVSGATHYYLYEQNVETKEYVECGYTKKTQFTFITKKNHNNKFKIVPVYKKSCFFIKGQGTVIPFLNKPIVSVEHQEYSFSEMESDMKALCRKYGKYVRYEQIGESVNGLPLYDIILGSDDAEQSLLVVCQLHAREYVTTIITMKQIEYYLQNYNKVINGMKVCEVFEHTQVHYVVMANPDGAEISQNSNPLWKANYNGVDLNRNFNYNWESGGSKKEGTSNGSCALSEPECKAVHKLTRRLNKEKPLAILNYHAMGEIVFGDAICNSKRSNEIMKMMYDLARRCTGYSSAAGYQSSNSKSVGNFREYVAHKWDIPCITIEVGSIPCPVPQHEYLSIFQDNKYVVLLLANMSYKR